MKQRKRKSRRKIHDVWEYNAGSGWLMACRSECATEADNWDGKKITTCKHCLKRRPQGCYLPPKPRQKEPK